MCFQNGGRPPSWIFVELKFRGISVSGTSVLVSEPYFVRICAIATELWPFKWIFKMAAVRHLELLFGILDHPRSFLVDLKACVQISCRSDLYLRRYLRSNISQVWLKTPIRAPKIYVLGGFWHLNITFHHRPPKGTSLAENRCYEPSRVEIGPAVGLGAVRRIQNKKAVLSQRWLRNAPYIWVPWKFSGLPDECLTTPTATVPNIFMGFCSDRLYECFYKIWSP